MLPGTRGRDAADAWHSKALQLAVYRARCHRVIAPANLSGDCTQGVRYLARDGIVQARPAVVHACAWIDSKATVN